MSRTDPRLYCLPEGPVLEAGQELSLLPAQVHYLGTVLRLGVGQAVRLFNERDGEWRATILDMHRQHGRVRLEMCERFPTAIREMIVLFAPLKRDATELIIRMGTEIGVTCFRPVITARTNTHRLNTQRLALIAQEAAEQCERLDVPALHPPAPLFEVLAAWPQAKPVAVALERRREAPVQVEANALLVGPEGGFAPEEIDRLMALEGIISPISLGPLILRAETAVVVGLSQLGAMHRLD